MKTHSILIIVLLLCSARGWGQQETYERFSAMDGIDAVYVKNYKCDSCNIMDVVLIRANDSTAWERLKKEFSIEPLSPQAENILSQGIDVFQMFITDKKDLTQRKQADLLDNCEVRVSFLKKEICIFYYRTVEQYRILHQSTITKLNKK